jgi:DNA polymerase elongation subunit (family B)
LDDSTIYVVVISSISLDLTLLCIIPYKFVHVYTVQIDRIDLSMSIHIWKRMVFSPREIRKVFKMIAPVNVNMLNVDIAMQHNDLICDPLVASRSVVIFYMHNFQYSKC